MNAVQRRLFVIHVSPGTKPECPEPDLAASPASGTILFRFGMIDFVKLLVTYTGDALR
jgi:hypothetical protein